MPVGNGPGGGRYQRVDANTIRLSRPRSHRRILRLLQPPTVALGAGLPHPAPGLRRSAGTCQFGAGKNARASPTLSTQGQANPGRIFYLTIARALSEDRVHLSLAYLIFRFVWRPL